MQSEQKKKFLLTVAYYAVLAAALYLFLRYLLWWLLPFLLAFAAARAMEPVILLLRRTVHFKRGFSAALLTLFLLFLLGGLLSLLLSALFTEATAFLTQLPTLLDALPVFGTGTALVPWALVTLLFGFPPRAIVLLALYLCTLITRNTLEPRLLSAQAGLPPVASLFAMYLGYCTFGIAGMVLFPFFLLLLSQIRNTRPEKA